MNNHKQSLLGTISTTAMGNYKIINDINESGEQNVRAKLAREITEVELRARMDPKIINEAEAQLAASNIKGPYRLTVDAYGNVNMQGSE